MVVVSSHRRFNIPFQHFIPLFLLLLFFSSFRNGVDSIAFFSSNTSRVDGGSRSCDQLSRHFTSPRGNALDLISSLSASSCVYNTREWTSRSASFLGSPWAAPNSNIPAILHYGTHRLLSTCIHAYPSLTISIAVRFSDGLSKNVSFRVMDKWQHSCLQAHYDWMYIEWDLISGRMLLEKASRISLTPMHYVHFTQTR